MSIRRAASWAQPRQLISVPRGARTGRGPAPDMADRLLRQPGHHELTEAPRTGGRDRHEDVARRQMDVIRVGTSRARPDLRLVAADGRTGVTDDAAGHGA